MKKNKKYQINLGKNQSKMPVQAKLKQAIQKSVQKCYFS